MGSEEFADRFDADRYRDEEPVRVWLVEGAGVDDEMYIPEPLWNRMRLIAAAYQLHLLPLLDGTVDPVFLNAVQCRTLVAELDFVAEILSDGLLEAVTSGLTLLARRGEVAAKSSLGFTFP